MSLPYVSPWCPQVGNNLIPDLFEILVRACMHLVHHRMLRLDYAGIQEREGVMCFALQNAYGPDERN